MLFMNKKKRGGGNMKFKNPLLMTDEEIDELVKDTVNMAMNKLFDILVNQVGMKLDELNIETFFAGDDEDTLYVLFTKKDEDKPMYCWCDVKNKDDVSYFLDNNWTISDINMNATSMMEFLTKNM